MLNHAISHSSSSRMNKRSVAAVQTVTKLQSHTRIATSALMGCPSLTQPKVQDNVARMPRERIVAIARQSRICARSRWSTYEIRNGQWSDRIAWRNTIWRRMVKTLAALSLAGIAATDNQAPMASIALRGMTEAKSLRVLHLAGFLENGVCWSSETRASPMMSLK